MSDLRRFYLSRGLSQSGQGVFMAGILLLAGGSGAAAAGLSGVFVAMMLGAIVCGLPAGALVDRLGPPRALFAGATGRALVMASLLVVPANPVTLAIAAFAYSAASQLFSPAELAMVPTAARDRHTRAHSILVGLQFGGQAVAFLAIVPLVLYFGSAEALIGAALVIYLGVVATTALIAARLGGQTGWATQRRAFSFRGPLRYFSGRSTAGYAGLLLAFGELSSKALVVAVPAYVVDDLRLGGPELGLVAVPAIAGVVIGLIWTSRHLHIGQAAPILRICLLTSVVAVATLAGLGYALAGMAEMSNVSPLESLTNARGVSTVLLSPVGLVLGLCFTITPIAGRAILSATAPEGEQGRVFAMQGLFSDLVCMMPLALSGLSTEIAGARPTFALVGVLGLALLIVLERTHVHHRGAGGLRPLRQSAHST